MKTEDKIKRKIKKKERELKNIKENIKGYKEKCEKDEGEDLRFKNIINPFYKEKHNTSAFMLGIFFMYKIESDLKKEIKELKGLIKWTEKIRLEQCLWLHSC